MTRQLEQRQHPQDTERNLISKANTLEPSGMSERNQTYPRIFLILISFTIITYFRLFGGP